MVAGKPGCALGRLSQWNPQRTWLVGTRILSHVRPEKRPGWNVRVKMPPGFPARPPVSYTHLRAHETRRHL
eukprot:7330183-Prorocentrum_lima.AAC.1